MRITLTLLLASGLCAAAFGCTASDPSGPSPDITRDDARALGGKQDGLDICEWLGWYGDGICDEFCAEPDPDCEGACRTDSDCPVINCFRAPCPTSVCVSGACVIDNPEDRCDAGERECQTCGDNFVCTPHAASCPEVWCPPPGDVCGGTEDVPCSDPGQFCLRTDDAMCGATDEQGICTDRPTACTRELRPVCGCDGETYSNRCGAHAAGVSVLHEGECEAAAEVCGGRLGNTCSDSDQFCLYEDAAMCGAADRTGTCTDRPEVCPEIYGPVCGCDGETYSNRCFANGAGTSVAHEGECETAMCELTVDPSDPYYGRFEGTGLDNTCTQDEDCIVGGCSGEVCAAESAFSTCEVLPVFPTGSCSCVEGVCNWARGTCN